MKKLQGHYFDGKHPVAIPASLQIENREHAILTFGEDQETFDFAGIRSSPAIADAPRFLDLPNGGQFLCEHSSDLDAFVQESRSEGPVDWLERRWGIALGCVAVIASMLAWGYFRGVPLAAEVISKRIEPQTEQTLGRGLLKALDQGVLRPTQLEPARIKAIQSGFEKLVKGLPDGKSYKLEMRESMAFGPNAFALPGDTIVLTDELVKFSVSDDEILAVLAHEIGHEELRHPIKMILQDSAVAVLAAAITHDAVTAGSAVTGAPVLLAQMKYSRENESAADDYAFELLKGHGLSPLAFKSIMERFSKTYGDKPTLSFLASHPASSERAEKALKATMTFNQPLAVYDYKMAPFLRYGRRVRVTPISSVRRGLVRGDVVAIYTQADGFFFTRIVGMPFDRIELNDGDLRLNGSSILLNRVPTEECKKLIASVYGGDDDLKKLRPGCQYELAGSTKFMTLSDKTSFDFFSPHVDGKDEYFVMEDNRIAITPSTVKAFEAVPATAILGLVQRL